MAPINDLWGWVYDDADFLKKEPDLAASLKAYYDEAMPRTIADPAAQVTPPTVPDTAVRACAEHKMAFG